MRAFTRTSPRKVAIVGPESTGKTRLAESLAAHFDCPWVPEYARGYIDNLTRPYNQGDLTTIAHGQVRLEEAFTRNAEDLLICDTNLYVIKIWSEFKYGNVDAGILLEIQKRKYDLYLLTCIDVPWEEDPQREHPDKREELYAIYLKEMQNQAVPFVEIKGEYPQRLNTAVQAIEKILT